MDYKKQINNKKSFNSILEKVTSIAKMADEKIREISIEAEEKLKETTTTLKETIQNNLNDSFKKNIQALAIEYVEKTLISNGVNNIKSLVIGVKETGEYLSVERIIKDLCDEYSQPIEYYMTDVYKYNLFGNLVLFFSTNEQVDFIKNEIELFTLTLKDVEKTTCECNCDGTCSCNGECTCHNEYSEIHKEETSFCDKTCNIDLTKIDINK